MIQEQAQILWNKSIGPGYARIGLACGDHYSDTMAGQFVMLDLETQPAPLLRRPFSVARRLENDGRFAGIELLIKVVGSGTALLAGLREGGRVGLLGPLGRGFRIDWRAEQRFLVAGGIGVAPMLMLAENLTGAGVDPASCRFFLGGRSESDLLCREDIAALGMPLEFSTDDGSAGDQCLITHPVEVAIAQRRPDVIYACGPWAMLACVAGFAEAHQIPCQVSVETMMGCGLGACLGCAIATHDAERRYHHACMDGPVFDAGMLEWVP